MPLLLPYGLCPFIRPVVWTQAADVVQYDLDQAHDLDQLPCQKKKDKALIACCFVLAHL